MLQVSREGLFKRVSPLRKIQRPKWPRISQCTWWLLLTGWLTHSVELYCTEIGLRNEIHESIAGARKISTMSAQPIGDFQKKIKPNPRSWALTLGHVRCARLDDSLLHRRQMRRCPYVTRKYKIGNRAHWKPALGDLVQRCGLVRGRTNYQMTSARCIFSYDETE